MTRTRKWAKGVNMIFILALLLTLVSLGTESATVLAADIVLDNTDATITGAWTTSTANGSYYSSNYLTASAGSGAKTVRWNPIIPETGKYEIYYWLPDGTDQITMTANYKVADSSQTTTYRVDQRTGGKWVLLGKHHFVKGSSGYVEIDDNPEDGKTIIADAIKLVKEGDMEARQLDTGYLVDEMFQMQSGNKLIGWNVDDANGEGGIANIAGDPLNTGLFYSILNVRDWSYERKVKLEKPFLRQSGPIAMEYKFMIDSPIKVDNKAVTTLEYNGSWAEVSDSNSYNGTYHTNGAAGSYVELTFTGTYIDLYLRKGPAGGKADVFVDGNLVLDDYDTYNSSVLSKQLAYSNAALSPGEHTIQLYVTGTKNASSTGTYIMFDYYEHYDSTNRFNDASFELMDGLQSAVKIKTLDGNLVYENANGGNTVLQSYNEDQWIGIKVTADPTTDKADIYIDGVLRASAVDFSHDTNGLDRLKISTGIASKGMMGVSAVKVYKGFHLYESFMTEKAGAAPSAWTVDQTGGTGVVQSILNGEKPFDSNLFKFNDTSGSAGVALTNSFTAQSGKIDFEYKFMLPVKLDGVAMELRSGATSAVKLLTSGGNISYENSGGAAQTLIPGYKANVWYTVKVTADSSTDKTDIVVNNGVAAASGVSFRNPAAFIDTVRFATPSAGTGDLYVDDIYIHDYIAPSSVPSPNTVAPATGKYVGPQVFSGGFREGQHNAWSSIYKSPTRKPLLGWYDEGNPEIADWEIKWMLEHGMNMFSTLWFRGLNANDTAPKSSRKELPFNSFLKSKFIDDIHFWIVFSIADNSSVEDLDDWNDHLVPYWVEHFFKHPSYLVMNNKPVFGVLNNPLLISMLGSKANVAAALSSLEQAAIAEGFDGVIFVAQERRSTAVDLQNIADSGYDYIYSYNWAEADGTDANAIQEQKDALEAQRDLGIIDVIPSISVSWDDVPPWHDAARIFRLTPSGFESLADWTQDTYMPSLPSGTLGRDMILFDNWNEFGEGHFIHPATDYGFGYLDAIRNVFTSASQTHTDIVPEDVDLGPYDVLFPHGWTAGVPGNYRIDNESSALTYSGAWNLVDDSDDHGGSYSSSAVAGHYVEYAFTGTSVKVVGRKGAYGGIVDIYLDGNLVVDDYDTYHDEVEHRQVFYENSSMSTGTHTIKLYVTGTKNPLSNGSLGMLDYFEYNEDVNKVDNESPSLTYDGTWTRSSSADDYMGSYETIGSANNYVQYSFTGTGVKVVGRKGQYGGKVDVYLDGNLVLDDYDTYSSYVLSQQVFYENNSLPVGSHTIKLVATGTKNSNSSGTFAMFDYFEYSDLSRIDNTSTVLKYDGSWTTASDANDYRGSYSTIGSAGNYVQHAFTGTSVQVAVRKGAYGGKVDVYLDGSLVLDDYDTYNSIPVHQQVIYSNNSLLSGSHTIKLVVTGTKNPSSGGTFVMFDYIEVQ